MPLWDEGTYILGFLSQYLSICAKSPSVYWGIFNFTFVCASMNFGLWNLEDLAKINKASYHKWDLAQMDRDRDTNPKVLVF